MLAGSGAETVAPGVVPKAKVTSLTVTFDGTENVYVAVPFTNGLCGAFPVMELFALSYFPSADTGPRMPSDGVTGEVTLPVQITQASKMFAPVEPKPQPKALVPKSVNVLSPFTLTKSPDSFVKLTPEPSLSVNVMPVNSWPALPIPTVVLESVSVKVLALKPKSAVAETD